MKRILLLFFCVNLLQQVATGQEYTGWATQNGGTTGGVGGEVVTVTNRSQLANFAGASAPYIIQIIDTLDLDLYEMVNVEGNKTIVGLGQGAAIRYGGLRIVGDNVIVQNLNIFGSYDGDWDGKTHSTDGITVYGAKNVWIDHCWLHLCADGALDVRSNGLNNIGDFVTISWTRFSDHNKVMLIGSSDNNTYNRNRLRVTLDHCWWDGTLEKGLGQRMPRVRFGDIHVLNCFYEEAAAYGVGANFESDVVIENTYFRNTPDPHIIGNVGEGIEDPDIVAINNIYEYSNGRKDVNGTAFQPSDYYVYTPVPTEEVPTRVMNGAGPLNNPDNIAPIANTDEVDLVNLTALVFIEPVENDTDADGGDLRIARIINEPVGEWGIQTNRILYRPDRDSRSNDTLLYELVDTQGGVDTGVILINNPLATNTQHIVLPEHVLEVWPNPMSTNSLIQISYRITDLPAVKAAEAVELRVFDLQGRQMQASFNLLEKANGEYRFQLAANSLVSGTYLLQVQQGALIASERLIVK